MIKLQFLNQFHTHTVLMNPLKKGFFGWKKEILIKERDGNGKKE